MNKAKAARICLGSQTYDLALPQTWLDHWSEKLKELFDYHEILGNIVWLYPDRSVEGRPCAVTHLGNEILKCINTPSWREPYIPLTDRPADRTPEGLDLIAKHIFTNWKCFEPTDKWLSPLKDMCHDDPLSAVYLLTRFNHFFCDNNERNKFLATLETLIERRFEKAKETS